MKSKKSYTLDLIRSLACMMVVAVHLNQSIIFPGLLGELFSYGGYGVDIFFFLSGFFAFKSFENALNENNNSLIKASFCFYKKRALRILPLYYLFVLFYYLISKIGVLDMPADVSGIGWKRYSLMINLWIKSDEKWMNLQGLWCVSVFALFYLIVPFYYLLFRKFYSSILGFVLLYSINVIIRHSMFNRSPLLYLYIFGFGILINRVVEEKRYSIVNYLFILSIASIFISNKEGWSLLFIIAIYIIGACYRQEVKASNVEYIGREVVNIISEYSYTIYFVHLAVLFVLDYCGVSNWLCFLATFVIATICTSFVIHNTIEKWVPIFLFRVRHF